MQYYNIFKIAFLYIYSTVRKLKKKLCVKSVIVDDKEWWSNYLSLFCVVKQPICEAFSERRRWAV